MIREIDYFVVKSNGEIIKDEDLDDKKNISLF
jgi:hypothetical protein